MCMCVCECVCMCVCVCICMCSGLCSRYPIETLRVRSPPSTVSHVFLLLLYLRVVTNSQMSMSEYIWWKKNGIVTGQNQALRAVWCKTRLLNSGGQFDQTCNLFGCNSSTRPMLAHRILCISKMLHLGQQSTSCHVTLREHEAHSYKLIQCSMHLRI